MTVLALDLGVNTGWARRTHDGRITSGVETFPKRPKDTPADRLERFYGWLHAIAPAGLDLIVYERAFGAYKGRQPQHVFAHFEAAVLLFANKRGARVNGVAQATLKKNAAGSGKAEKRHVIAAVQALGYKPRNDDEADALALLLTQTGELRATPWPKAPRKPKPRPARGPALDLEPKPF